MDSSLSLNRYVYVQGNPVSAVDPSGENPLLAACAGGALFGAATDVGINWLTGEKITGSQILRSAGTGCLFGLAGFGAGKIFRFLLPPGPVTQFPAWAVAEGRVAQAIGVPRNIGHGRVIVHPGSGPGGYRVPDFDPALTIAARGSIVEVKTGKRLYITPQLRDLAQYARQRQVKLEIFSNAPRPTRGELARLIKEELVILSPIP